MLSGRRRKPFLSPISAWDVYDNAAESDGIAHRTISEETDKIPEWAEVWCHNDSNDPAESKRLHDSCKAEARTVCANYKIIKRCGHCLKQSTSNEQHRVAFCWSFCDAGTAYIIMSDWTTDFCLIHRHNSRLNSRFVNDVTGTTIFWRKYSYITEKASLWQ